MQFKGERWNGNERQELVQEIKQADVEKAVTQQLPTELVEPEGLKEQATRERILQLTGEEGVEVVVMATSARAVARCLEAYHRARVHGVRYSLTVVDGGGGEFCSSTILALAEKHGFKLLSSPEPGELPALCAALAQSKARWFVVLDENVRVFDRWLEHLLDQACGRTIMVTACSNRITPVQPGMSAEAMSESFHGSVASRGAQIPFPRACCLLVNREALDDCGGFDVDYYRPGGGQFLDLFLRAHGRGYLVKLAERCWVHDESVDYRGGAAWEPRHRQGFYRFLSRHGKKALTLQQSLSKEVDFPRSIAAQFKPSLGERREVVFVLREAVVCGLVLAVAEVCNGLNRTGRWNAYFACTRLDEPERRRIPMGFAPVVAEGGEVGLQRFLATRRSALVVSTLWSNVEDVQGANLDPSCRWLYFIQDDERRFRHATGAPYVEPERVVNSWRAVKDRVVNSRWVRDELRRLGLPAKRIGIGVDTLRFHPGPREGALPRVMAHCRPSTPRRGWPFVRDVLNRAWRSAEFEVVTYDEKPEGLEVGHHTHLGRVSPDELAFHMGRSDVFFEGSEFQGWGMQALEAMSCGCALVSTDNEGVHEFATAGWDCALVPHGQVELAAAVVCHLVGHPAERESMQDRARKSALAFDWQAVCHAWDEHLRGVCAGM